MAQLDGSALAKYRGHAKIETILTELIKTRQAMALHLLDTGIVQEPSLYMTQAPDFLVDTPQHIPTRALARFSGHVSKMTAPGSGSASSSTATTSVPVDAPISFYACVLYLLLVTPEDASMGWEIGAALANGQMVKMKRCVDH